MSHESLVQKQDKLYVPALEWGRIRDCYGYEEIQMASQAALANLKTVAPIYGDPDDYFKGVRSQPHIDLFDPPVALFLKPSIKHGELYRMLSGWFMLPKETRGFTYMNKHWKSLEHAYQASKFVMTDQNIAVKIQKAYIPKVAKQTSGKYPELVREDWEDVREMAMLGATLAIVDQFYPIQVLLESTEEAVLIEDSMQDSKWGRGVDFAGGNGLGRTWMMAREIMRTGQERSVQAEIESYIR